MMKRGDIHVDWILSMGLFLISTIALFIFFRPTDVPEVNKGVLMDNLIRKFENNFTWEVKTTPVFVRKCEGYIDENNDPVEIKIKINNNWMTGKVDYVYGNEKYSWDDLEEIKCPPPPENHQPPDKFFIDGIAFFYYTVYENLQFPPKLIFTAECDPDLEEHCDFSLGGAETFEGINDGTDLQQFRNYLTIPQNNPFNLTNIKGYWDFPERNDFWVLACDPDKGDPCNIFGEGEIGDYFVNYKTANPYQQADIFAKEIKTFIVDKKGDKKPVTIIFRVW